LIPRDPLLKPWACHITCAVILTLRFSGQPVKPSSSPETIGNKAADASHPLRRSLPHNLRRNAPLPIRTDQYVHQNSHQPDQPDEVGSTHDSQHQQQYSGLFSMLFNDVVNSAFHNSLRPSLQQRASNAPAGGKVPVPPLLPTMMSTPTSMDRVAGTSLPSGQTIAPPAYASARSRIRALRGEAGSGSGAGAAHKRRGGRRRSSVDVADLIHEMESHVPLPLPASPRYGNSVSSSIGGGAGRQVNGFSPAHPPPGRNRITNSHGAGTRRPLPRPNTTTTVPTPNTAATTTTGAPPAAEYAFDIGRAGRISISCSAAHRIREAERVRSVPDNLRFMATKLGQQQQQQQQQQQREQQYQKVQQEWERASMKRERRRARTETDALNGRAMYGRLGAGAGFVGGV
jgi:hypothetical protein